MYMYMYIHVHGRASAKNAEGRGFKSHPRQQFFFERLLPWDLICTSFLQVSEYLSYMYQSYKCTFERA